MSAELTRIGLLGGMSCESTAVYYRLLNELVQERVGGHASAPVIVWSVDFAEIERYQRDGDWAAQGRLLADAALKLEQAGAEAIALGTNTLHLVAEQISAPLHVPFVDLIDVAAKATQAAGYTSVGLLATSYTMASDLYPKRFATYGIDVQVPAEDDRETVHRIIYDELVHGVIREESRASYLAVIDRLVAAGVEAIVFGCTEIGLLVSASDTSVPLLDTASLHCQALADIIVNGVRG
ncbi:MAG TPA: aspartate/glutamate racemase family protein [Jatrophihabitans sp.]